MRETPDPRVASILGAAMLAGLLGATLPAAADEPPTPPTLADVTARLDSLQTVHGVDAIETAETHDELLALYLDAGELAASLRHARRAVEIRAAHLPAANQDLAITRQELGFAHYRVEDYASAAAEMARSLDAWLALPDASAGDVAWCGSDLAEMYRLSGNFPAAEATWRTALVRARAEPDASAYVPVLVNNLGGYYWDQDRLDEAEPLLRESLRLREGSADADPWRVATARKNLGVLLRSQHALDEAENLLGRALEEALATGAAIEKLVPFRNALAGVYSLTGRFPEARVLREESLAALASAVQPNRVMQGEILHRLGQDLLANGDLEEAGRRFREARDVRTELFGAQHVAVGQSLFGIARVLEHTAGAGSDSVGVTVRGALDLLGDTSVASADRARALALHARHLRARGEAALARQRLASAMDLAEELRAHRGGGDESRLVFLEEFRIVGNDLVAWYADDGDAEGAFRASERIKARVLRDQLAASRVDLRRGIPKSILEPLEAEEASLRARVHETRRRVREIGSEPLQTRVATLADLEGQLDDAIRQLNDVTDRIRLHSPAWKAALVHASAEVSGAAIRSEALGPDEALVSYQVGPKRSWAFVVAPGTETVRAVELLENVAGAPTPLTEARVAQLVEGLSRLHAPRGVSRGVSGVVELSTEESNPEFDPALDVLRDLARVLLPSEVRQALASASGVVVVPDGRLHAVPFEALVLNDAGRPPRFWLDAYPATRYAHAVSTLLDDGDDEAAVGTGLVSFCDPAFGDAFPALPGTARESAAVVAAVGEASSKVFRGEAASEASFVEWAPRARWLHLATHGVVDRHGSGRLSSLVFARPADASTSDGHLHLWELRELNLACDLAVLSACDTNAGRLVEGEGVFALSRGFLAAGAARVVSSLWPLHDEAAANLTGSLFSAVQGRQPAYDRALHEAKRALRMSDRWNHPHYWAPFVLTVRGSRS